MKETTYLKLEPQKQEQGIDVGQLIGGVEEFYNKIRFTDAGRFVQSKLIDYYIKSTLNEDTIDQLIKIGDLKNNTRIIDAFIGFYKFLNEKDSMNFSVWLVKLANSNNALLIKIRNAEIVRVEELKAKKIYKQIKWGIAVAVLAVFLIMQINIGKIRAPSSSQKPSTNERIQQDHGSKIESHKIFSDKNPQDK